MRIQCHIFLGVSNSGQTSPGNGKLIKQTLYHTLLIARIARIPANRATNHTASRNDDRFDWFTMNFGFLSLFEAFTHVVEEMKSKQKFILSTIYCNKYNILL